MIDLGRMSGYKVAYQGISIGLEYDKLTIEVDPGQNNYESLAKALKLARKTLDSLPQTPISAAGINVHFVEDGKDETLNRALDGGWKVRLEAAGYTAKGLAIVRTVGFMEGSANLTISQIKDDDIQVFVNFERHSEDLPEIRKWVNIPVEDIQKIVDQLLRIAKSGG